MEGISVALCTLFFLLFFFCFSLSLLFFILIYLFALAVLTSCISSFIWIHLLPFPFMFFLLVDFIVFLFFAIVLFFLLSSFLCFIVFLPCYYSVFLLIFLSPLYHCCVYLRLLFLFILPSMFLKHFKNVCFFLKEISFGFWWYLPLCSFFIYYRHSSNFSSKMSSRGIFLISHLCESINLPFFFKSLTRKDPQQSSLRVKWAAAGAKKDDQQKKKKKKDEIE